MASMDTTTCQNTRTLSADTTVDTTVGTTVAASANTTTDTHRGHHRRHHCGHHHALAGATDGGGNGGADLARHGGRLDCVGAPIDVVVGMSMMMLMVVIYLFVPLALIQGRHEDNSRGARKKYKKTNVKSISLSFSGSPMGPQEHLR